ncbi:MAG: ABC-2 transporter permease [Lachnospiraceae bacterium]
MAGLLYKDFVSVSGKKILIIIICLTIAFIGLRMAFPGNLDNALFMAETEEGEMINILDLFFITGLGSFLIFIFSIINGWVGKIVDGDDKNKIRGYLNALPLEKNAYWASKYIFIGITAYVLMSIAMSWDIAANAFCREGMFSDVLSMIGAMIPSVIYIVLLSAAIELPMFLIFGKNKAMLIKIAIIMTLAFFVIGFLLFGDFVWIEQHLNISVLLKWYEDHLFAVSLLNILFPVITLILYYLSYRITCHFAGRKAA